MELVLRALDWLLIAAGCVGIAYSFVILRLYWNDRRARHIAALGVGWVVLAAMGIWRVIEGSLGPPAEVVMLFALLVSDWGLIWLWCQHWTFTRADAPRRRRSDPPPDDDQAPEGPFEE